MSGNDRTFLLDVEFRPPVKQAPADTRERVRQIEATAALGAAFQRSYPEGFRMWVLQVDLDMDIEYRRGAARSDSANIIGGIADQLERLNVYHSDSQLRRITYSEHPASDGADRYRVRVATLPRLPVVID